GIARPTPATCGHFRLFCVRNSLMAEIQAAMTAAVPFCELVGRWSNLVVTASPFSRTAAILEVVAPLSVPMKILSLMSARQVADSGDKGKNYSPFAVNPV